MEFRWKGKLSSLGPSFRLALSPWPCALSRPHARISHREALVPRFPSRSQSSLLQLAHLAVLWHSEQQKPCVEVRGRKPWRQGNPLVGMHFPHGYCGPALSTLFRERRFQSIRDVWGVMMQAKQLEIQLPHGLPHTEETGRGGVLMYALEPLTSLFEERGQNI